MLFLDTSAVIELFKGNENGKKILDLINNDKICITVFTVYELYFGIKDSELNKLTEFFDSVEVIPFMFHTARKAAGIKKELKNKGSIIEEIDILIATTCLYYKGKLITLDKDFKNIKNLDLILIK